MATIIVLLVLVFVVMPCVVVVCTAVVHLTCPKLLATREKISDAYDTLKTGDLIMFVARDPIRIGVFASHTVYGHVGAVVMKDDIAYISETTPASELMQSVAMAQGANQVPLLTRLKFYNGSYFLLRLSRPLDNSRLQAFANESARLADEQFPYPSAGEIVLGMLGFKTTASHVCFQHVAHLLRVANLERLGESMFQASRDVAHIVGRKLRDGYEYCSPIELLYDVDTDIPGDVGDSSRL